MRKYRIAFLSGLGSGGTERWMQLMAANLPKEMYEIDYYFSGIPDTQREKYMIEKGVNLIAYPSKEQDEVSPQMQFVEFWDHFNDLKYDWVQRSLAGPANYLSYSLKYPIIDFVALNAGVDQSENVIWSIHPSEWQRNWWFSVGGERASSSVIPVPIEYPTSKKNLKDQLGILQDHIVTGLHQRVDDRSFSPVPLQAFSKIINPNFHFIIMGGSILYRRQAKEMGLSNVHFIEHSGSWDNISAFLNSIDFFSHGRRDGETFGTVLAEAMIHGKPCLSHFGAEWFCGNAQPETMGPGGLWATNFEQYVEKMQKLFLDSELRKRLGVFAKKHAEDHYVVDKCVAKLSELYKRTGRDLDKTKNAKVVSYKQVSEGYLKVYSSDSQKDSINDFYINPIEKANRALLSFFSSKLYSFLDIEPGKRRGGFIVAAKNESASVHVIDSLDFECCTIKNTINMNNWCDRVFLHRINLKRKVELFEQYAFVPHDVLDRVVERLRIKSIDVILLSFRAIMNEIILGAEETIAKYHPVLIFDPVHSYGRLGQVKTDLSAYGISSLLKEKGYRFWRVSEDCNLIELTNITKGLKSTYGFIVCVHSETHVDLINQLEKIYFN